MGYNFSTTQRVIDGTGRILVGTVNPDAGFYVTEAQLKSYVLSALGQANGIATLDSSGKLTASQLPSKADDVQIVNPLPASGETGKLYVRTTDLTMWYWNGSAYVQLADIVTQSITNGDTTHAPSGDAVYDALAQKVALPNTTPTQYNMAYFGSNGDLVDAGFTYLEALKSIVITDSTTTVADIASQLTTINNNGDHVFFDVSALGAGMYLCTIFTDTANQVYKVFDLVSGRFTSGSYDNSTLLAMVLANADTVATQKQIDNLQTQINELGGKELITDWGTLGDKILDGTSPNYVSAGDTIDINWAKSVTGTSSIGNTVTCTDMDKFVRAVGKAEEGVYYLVYDGSSWTYDGNAVSDIGLSVSGSRTAGEVLTMTVAVNTKNYTFTDYDGPEPVDPNVPHNWCLEQTYAPDTKAWDTYESLFCIKGGKSVPAGNYRLRLYCYRSGFDIDMYFSLPSMSYNTDTQMVSGGPNWTAKTITNADNVTKTGVYVFNGVTPREKTTGTSRGSSFMPVFEPVDGVVYTDLLSLNVDVNDPVIVPGNFDTCVFGNNTWPYANIRQWLNDDTSGDSYAPTHDNDVPSSYNRGAGFLWGMDPRVRNLIQKAKVKWTAGYGAPDDFTRNTTYTSEDDVFLLSMKEMSFNLNTDEGDITDLYGIYTNNTLTNNAVAARAKYNKAGGTLNSYRWSRSASTGDAYSSRSVISSGSYDVGSCGRGPFFAPAFIVGKASS